VVCYANSGFRAVIGDPSTPLIGRKLEVLMAGESGTRLAGAVHNVFETGVAHHESSFEFEDALGSRYYEIRIEQVRLVGDQRHSICIVLSPRTESVLIRQALEDSNVRMGESQSSLEALLEHTNNGIFLVDTDLTVLYTNRRMGELFGFDPRAMVGKSKLDITDQLFMEQMADPFGFRERLLYLYSHMEEIAQDEVEVSRPVHRILDRYSAPVYRNDGSLLGRLEVYYDVTEVRQLQRNKDEFLSLVSHELRTPITSIKGYAQLLQRRARNENVPPQIALAYSTIERQAVRMQELIDTLLDMTRLDADRLRLDRRNVDICSLVSRCVEMLKIVSEAHVLSADMPENPVIVSGDERRLEQVVMNLLTNAIRYSPEGGHVRVSVRTLDDSVTITVADQGIGIATDALDRVFERFFRAADVPQSTGLGIGLYITRGIVERHGGHISVQSTVGQGSEFTVTLPREPRPVPTAE
ncbi:MAG TPA: ATP-binding protein, partial [Chloroflexota bacterium]